MAPGVPADPRPALVTVTIYQAVLIWNNFLLPLVLTQSPDKRTLPLALWTFQGQYAVNVPAVLASVLLTALPIFVLYVVWPKRQLVRAASAEASASSAGRGNVAPASSL